MGLSDLTCPSVGMQQGPSIGVEQGRGTRSEVLFVSIDKVLNVLQSCNSNLSNSKVPYPQEVGGNVRYQKCSKRDVATLGLFSPLYTLNLHSYDVLHS